MKEHNSRQKKKREEKREKRAAFTASSSEYSNHDGGNKRAEGMRKIEIKMELLFMKRLARLLWRK